MHSEREDAIALAHLYILLLFTLQAEIYPTVEHWYATKEAWWVCSASMWSDEWMTPEIR